MAINLAPRFIRKTFLLAKLEGAYGVSADPTAADAILISEVELSYTSNNKARDVVRPYLGASQELVGDDNVTISFSVEMAPSGIAGTEPDWGILLKACGMSSIATANARVEYVPTSSSFSSLTFWYVIDGLRYKATGARGTYELMLNVGETPKLKFTFTALFDGEVTTFVADGDFRSWKTPLVVANHNTGDVSFGGVYSAGAITGATDPFASRGISLNIGNNVVYQPMLGSVLVNGSMQSVNRVLITDRQASGSITLDLNAAQEQSFRNDVRGNVARSVSFTHGTTAGSKLMLYMPNVQMINPKIVDQDSIAMTSFDLRVMPTEVGNDELRIVCM
jgi:hypothetical protein